jgi:hypothetical protein
MTTPVTRWVMTLARSRNRRLSSSGHNNPSSNPDKIAMINVGINAAINAGMMAIVIGTRVIATKVRLATTAMTGRSGATKTSNRIDFAIVAIATTVGNASVGNKVIAAIGLIVGIVKTVVIATGKTGAAIAIGRPTIAMISDRNHDKSRVKTLGAMIAVPHPIA